MTRTRQRTTKFIRSDDRRPLVERYLDWAKNNPHHDDIIGFVKEGHYSACECGCIEMSTEKRVNYQKSAIWPNEFDPDED